MKAASSFFTREHMQILKECIENQNLHHTALHRLVAVKLFVGDENNPPENFEKLVEQTKQANYRLLWNRDFLATIHWTKVWP